VPDVFDIYTIIFLALAVFIFLRLRSVLGQRTGRERPPYDPYSARDAVRGATNDNVVTLPGRGGETTQKPVETPEQRAQAIARFSALPRYADQEIETLRAGLAESLDTSEIHLDILTNLKRISSHVSALVIPILEDV